MKNGEMKQSKKLLEYIAGIAGNCLTVCPSQEGRLEPSRASRVSTSIDGTGCTSIDHIFNRRGFSSVSIDGTGCASNDCFFFVSSSNGQLR
ncbi:hypothetical protein F2Q70_00005674 [Brassica cretica]|uniref:Uncharacterized protein n=1 Tax=Brassica cretica TaxID=69181 RepID=A0A8S9J047_BRACR|nr:hypothetical protein F2Q70_00005674 [Brassica cretica]